MLIYLDHAATTKVLPEVRAAMIPYLDHQFGNPSSMHQFGRNARLAIDEARNKIAIELGTTPSQIVFTSGGTESDNLALLGVALQEKENGKNHIITTQIEHHAVLDTCQYLEKIGFEVTYLPVDMHGRVDVNDVRQHIRSNTALISVMYGNNEVGTLQPIYEIGNLAKEYDILFHTDAVQAFGIEQIKVNKLEVDLLTLSSHKIGGPKGVGALYLSERVKLLPRMFGGAQELRRRPGTENVPGIIGFGKAVELMADKRETHRLRMIKLRKLMIDKLVEKGIQFTVNGDQEKTMPHICNLSFPIVDSETMLINLDMEGVAASSGSACTSGSLQQSHVLVAMQLPADVIGSAIRFSFGLRTSADEVIKTCDIIERILERLK